MRRLLALSLLLAATACVKPPAIKPTDGTEPGAYRVAHIKLDAADEIKNDATMARGSMAELAEFKSLLVSRLPAALAPYGRGRDVEMELTITSINFDLNPLRDLLMEDHLEIGSRVKLIDTKTQVEVGTVLVGAFHSRNMHGLIGMIDAATDSDETIQGNKLKLVDDYVAILVRAIYPLKDEK